MQRFSLIGNTENVVFYPILNGNVLAEQDVALDFPLTYAYLQKHREILENRSSVRNGHLEWWRPERLRTPETLFRPKVVAPHLMLLPRFGLDGIGKYAISRSPYIFHLSNDLAALKLLLAFLNSTIGQWQIATQSHRYSRGYARLEASTLRGFQVPDFSTLAPELIRNIVRFVDLLIDNAADLSAEEKLNLLVLDAYGIDPKAVEGFVIPSEID